MRFQARTIGSDVKDVSSELLITSGGIVSSLLVVGANDLFTRTLDYNFLSMNIWFVVPIGAIFGGIGAAWGYYLTAIYLQRMPSRKLLWNMVAIGLSTWVLVKWLPYVTTTLNDGRHVSDLVSFVDYMRFEIEHTQLTFGTRTNVKMLKTDGLGTLGYVREVLEILGFMAGGFATYLMLVAVEACEKCQRYSKNTKLLDQVGADRFHDVLAKTGLALSVFADEARSMLGSEYALKDLSLSLHQCPLCSERWLRPSLTYSNGENERIAVLRRYDVNAEMAGALQLYSEHDS